jgi:hypothetical protein
MASATCSLSLDGFAAGQIRDGAADFDDAVVGAGFQIWGNSNDFICIFSADKLLLCS